MPAATVTTVLSAAHTGRQHKPKVIARNVPELGRGRSQIHLLNGECCSALVAVAVVAGGARHELLHICL
jgi:hypothetical protein